MVAVNDKFPTETKFVYVPITPETSDIKACGIPGPLDFDKEFADKTVVIVSIPGAFTPTCMENHVPPFLEHLSDLKAKGVDVFIVVAANDPFVMSAFAKANKVSDDSVYFVTDPDAELSKKLGFTLQLPPGFGLRTGRYALVVKKGVITYVGNEPGSGLTVSSYESVIAAL
ncbi:putative peroxisomal protein [Myxozyma melibiosi]|uniref:Peroxisomal protein n=1 Tax=Myxozyma melibiosi TaxID=54550 RepID=A0ABR1F6Z5_9ASCO